MRARLALLAGATSSLILVAFLIPLAVLVRSAAADRAVSAAVVEVQTLAPAVATAPDDAAVGRAVAAANAAGGHPMTVYLPDGAVLGVAQARSDAAAEAALGQSQTVTVPGGQEVVIAVAGRPDGTAVIRTFVPDKELYAGVTRSWLELGLLGLGLLGLSVSVAVLLARSYTRQLSRLANVSYRLAQGSLGARASDEGPAELRQVAGGLNHLAGRIVDLLAQERATVADLSHRLRTPLTALRIDVESLTADDARDRLIADLDAIDRRVDEVIRDADRPVREGAFVTCDAADVVGERVRFWSALAEDERRPFESRVAPRELPAGLSAAELSACVDAAIGNVFAHTEEGTAFRVYLTARPSGGAILVIADDGHGFDSEAAERGFSGAGSTGLGLDIIRRAAERSGGGLSMARSASGGASLTVELGPPAPAIVRGHRERRLVP